MVDIEEAEKQAISLYHDLCKQHNLPQLKLSIGTRKSEKDSQGGYNGKEISIFVLTDASLENVLVSVKHEFRHQWQEFYYPDIFKWWRDHYSYYNRLVRDGYQAVYNNCNIEADARYFSEEEKDYRDVLLDKCTVEILERMMESYLAVHS